MYNYCWSSTKVPTIISSEEPFFTSLDIVIFILHLKLKYHNFYDEHIIVHVNLARVRPINETLLKNPTTTSFQKERKVKNVGLSNQSRLNINITYFDARLDKSLVDDQRDLLNEARLKIPMPIPDEEYTIVQLHENPSITVKIMVNLHDSVEGNLIKCLKTKVNLYIVSPTETPDI